MTYPDRTSSPYMPQRLVTPDERERVVEALCLHFAADHIGMDSLEQRLKIVYEAHTPAQLQDTLADLSPLKGEKIDAGQNATIVPPHLVPERSALLAFWGGVSRKGGWFVPRHLKIVALMGGADIDLRDAKFGAGVTEIEAYVVMGGIEITVPPGVRVESLGGAFMGGFDASAGDTTAVGPDAPVLRVSGLAVMGGVEVRVRKPTKKMLARFQAALHAAGLMDEVER